MQSVVDSIYAQRPANAKTMRVPWSWTFQHGLPIGKHLYEIMLRGNAPMTEPYRALAARHAASDDAEGDPLPCRLDEHGMFEIVDGGHRAAWRHHQRHETLAVYLDDVHPLWEWLDGELRAIYGDESLYQPVEHP